MKPGNSFLTLSDLSSIEKNNLRFEDSPSLLFIGDVHLGAYCDQMNLKLEKDLVDLLSYCEEHQITPVILGDLFDYWMEYPRKNPPLGTELLNFFSDYHQRTGHGTLFVTGNHDNWTYGYLNRIGFDVEHEFRIISAEDISMMVLHGDGLQNPAMNLPRPFMHRILRNSYFITVFQKIFPPRLGWFFMKRFSGISKSRAKTATSRKQRDKLDNWAKNTVMSNPLLHAVVYGHHHKPWLWEKQGNICLNCGSFSTYYSVGLYTNKKFQLVTWLPASKTFEPIQSNPVNTNGKKQF